MSILLYAASMSALLAATDMFYYRFLGYVSSASQFSGLWYFYNSALELLFGQQKKQNPN